MKFHMHPAVFSRIRTIRPWTRHCLWFSLAALILAAGTPAFGGNPGREQLRPASLEQSAKNRLFKINETLYTKTSRAVTDALGNPYAIDQSTLIVDTEGRQISIEALMVPSDVELTYQERNQGRRARRITVIREAYDATPEMSPVPGAVVPQ